jgi:hypothetical protein
MSKLSKTESTGPLNEEEISRCAELIHRAVVHEQGFRVVQTVSRHIHGRGTEVNVQEVFDKVASNMVPQAMTDASKRRLEVSDSEWSAVTQSGTEPRDEEPDAKYLEGYQHFKLKPIGSWTSQVPTDRTGKGVDVPLPTGVNSVMEWGRTIINMKKYADENISYGELVDRAANSAEHARYVQWIQSTYTPPDEEIVSCKKTQAVDFALYLKKIHWKRQENSEFVRCMK